MSECLDARYTSLLSQANGGKKLRRAKSESNFFLIYDPFVGIRRIRSHATAAKVLVRVQNIRRLGLDALDISVSCK